MKLYIHGRPHIRSCIDQTSIWRLGFRYGKLRRLTARRSVGQRSSVGPGREAEEVKMYKTAGYGEEKKLWINMAVCLCLPVCLSVCFSLSLTTEVAIPFREK